MTKAQMADSILFALDELGKAKADLAVGNYRRARRWLEFGIKTLEQCVKQELDDVKAGSD